MSGARGGPTAAGLVLRTVLQLGSAPRSAIAARARLSPATVSNQSRLLTEAGLLLEIAPGPADARIGRPHTPLVLDTDKVVAAVHFAATTTRVAVVDIAGRVSACEILPHRSTDGLELARTASAALERLLARRGGPAPFALGFATGGRVDPEAGVVHEHPFLDLSGVPVREILAERTGLPVAIDSHSRAIVHAEQLFGSLGFESSAAVLFVGNVLDAAFAVDGRVHYGPGASAGSLAGLLASAVPGGAGRLHELSDHALVRRAVGEGIVPAGATPSIPGLIDAARRDARVHRLFACRAQDMAQVAAALVDLLNPDRLIVTDRAFHRLPAVREAYQSGAQRYSDPEAGVGERVVGTSFPGYALETAAAATVLRRLYDDPLAVLGVGAAAYR